ETELSGHAPHHGNSGAEHGISEGHPGTPAAREGGHHRQRVHAGVAGERKEDGRIGLHHARERREAASEFEAFATKSRKRFRGACCKYLKVLVGTRRLELLTST